MWGDAPWPQSRPWPTTWTENTVQARGLSMEPTMEPEQAIASLLAWSAVTLVAGAAITASALLAAAKWFGGDR